MARMQLLSRIVLFFLLTLAVVNGPALADGLGTPTGSVILEISGKISNKNAGDVAAFDLDMLAKLPRRIIKTSTPWTEGVNTFEGVSGAALMKAVGASGTVVSAVALNDYKIEIPLSDFTEDLLIVADRINGETISVRKKGPLWVIFPIDANSRFRTEDYLGRSIWQLKKIEVR